MEEKFRGVPVSVIQAYLDRPRKIDGVKTGETNGEWHARQEEIKKLTGGIPIWSKKDPRKHTTEYLRFLQGVAIARDGDKCWFCGRPFQSRGPMICTVEHIVQRGLPGSEDPINARVAHKICNTSSGAESYHQKLMRRARYHMDPRIVDKMIADEKAARKRRVEKAAKAGC